MNQFGIGAGPNPFRGLLQSVCCVELKRGIKILNDYDESLTPPPIPSSRFIPKKYLREMKPEDHKVYRHLFSSAFTPDVVDESASFTSQHFRAGLLQLAEQSSSNGTRGVAPEEPIVAVTFGVFVRIFVGMFPDDERYGRLKELIDIIDLTNRNDREVNLALEECALILRGQARRVSSGQHDLPGSFVKGIAAVAPDAFEDLTAMRNFIYIMQASWIDAAGLIVWLFKELCDHSEWRKRIADGGNLDSKDDAESLSLRCVRETLRLRQSEYIYRKVLRDIPIDGFVVPKGWLLRVCVRESHRDPALFENPNEFNPDRFLRRRYSRPEYSTFGASRISCLGEHLTLTIGRIFVEAMAATVETSVIQNGPLEYRRWHWKPSSKWRVRIARL
jgi:cytochrome P450